MNGRAMDLSNKTDSELIADAAAGQSGKCQKPTLKATPWIITEAQRETPPRRGGQPIDHVVAPDRGLALSPG